MPKLTRSYTWERTQRMNAFGQSVADVERDDYEIEADTAGEIVVILQELEKQDKEKSS